jgi:hypothetical protein
MKRQTRLRHEFVEYVPDVLEDGTIYISVPFATAIHKCCCGCGNQVVTPLSPTDWKLVFDGVSVSLDPSIGNWSFPCQSHYWIRRNSVAWAPKWSRREIEQARASDRDRKTEYLEARAGATTDSVAGSDKQPRAVDSLWWKIKTILSFKGNRGEGGES